MEIKKSEITCKLTDEEVRAFNIVYNALEDLSSEMTSDDTMFANDSEYDVEELSAVRCIIDDIRQSENHIITIDRS